MTGSSSADMSSFDLATYNKLFDEDAARLFIGSGVWDVRYISVIDDGVNTRKFITTHHVLMLKFRISRLILILERLWHRDYSGH